MTESIPVAKGTRKRGRDSANKEGPPEEPKGTIKMDYPDAPLNHERHPRVMDLIIQYPDSWLPLRATNNAFRKRIEPLLYRHVVIASDDEVTDVYGEPLIDVRGPFSGLPQFKPRAYMEDDHPRSYHKAMYSWSKLLKHSTVIDVFSANLNCLQLDYLNDALVNIDTLRLFFDLDERAFLDPQGYCPIRGGKKVVLFPVRPSIDRGKASPILKLVGSERKVVSNVVYSDTLGACHAPLARWTAYWGSPLTDLKDVIYYFHNAKDWLLKPIAEAAAYCNIEVTPDDGLVHARWDFLLNTIVFLLQPAPFQPRIPPATFTFGDGGDDTRIMRPSITIVNFPIDVDLTTLTFVKMDELDPNPSPQECFANALKNAFTHLGKPDNNEYPKDPTELLNCIKFVSAADYAATITAAELKLEIQPCH